MPVVFIASFLLFNLHAYGQAYEQRPKQVMAYSFMGAGLGMVLGLTHQNNKLAHSTLYGALGFSVMSFGG